MNVKAQALLNAAQYIRAQYGDATLEEIVRTCSPQVRERLASGIAINWHPLDEFVEFLRVANRVIADPLLGERVGAAGARANTRGVMLRLTMLLARPELVLRRAATLWRQFNDAGELSLRSFESTAVEVVIEGIPRTPRIFCDTVTGWARELTTSAGGMNASAKHVECRSDGDARCVWVARWSPLLSRS